MLIRVWESRSSLQATLFVAAGAERPDDWQGTPLTSIPEDDRDRPVFCEYHGHGTRASAYLIRKGPWKYIHYVAAPHQLFNLEDDPEELSNCVNAHTEVASDLETELRRICDPEAGSDRAEEFIEAQMAELT